MLPEYDNPKHLYLSVYHSTFSRDSMKLLSVGNRIFKTRTVRILTNIYISLKPDKSAGFILFSALDSK